MEMKLSTLSVVLGLVLALPHLYGLANPKAFATTVRGFPRNPAVGWVLMLLGTIWFLYYVSQENVSDFANMKKIFYLLFGAVGIGACIFVQDFLAVRGLAVILLLAAKLMTDTARWEETQWRLVIATLAYLWAFAGMWFTVSPWRARDLLNWSVATDSRTRFTSGARVVLGLLLVVLGLTAFRAAEKAPVAHSMAPRTISRVS